MMQACLVCIIYWCSLNLGMIVGQDMDMTANSLSYPSSFQCWSPSLCRPARVLRDVKEMEMIDLFSTNIRWIVEEYLKRDTENKKAAPMDSSPVIHKNILLAVSPLLLLLVPPVLPFLPDQVLFLLLPNSPTTVVLQRMGQLFHSADRHTSRLEATIPCMIGRDLADVVTPLSFSIEALTTIIMICEQDQ